MYAYIRHFDFFWDVNTQVGGIESIFAWSDMLFWWQSLLIPRHVFQSYKRIYKTLFQDEFGHE